MKATCDITPGSIGELRDPALRQQAFDALIRSHLRPLYWYARRLVVIHEEAEDVVQETFIRAYNKIGYFRGGTAELTAWLYRITTNEALSALRRRKRHPFASLDGVSRELANHVTEGCGEEPEELLVRFQQAILELPLKQRLVFNLRYYDQMPYEQIAQVLEQDERTLRVNYHHAVKKLKEKLTHDIL